MIFRRAWIEMGGAMLVCATAGAATYDIIDLGALGGAASEAYGINAGGQVVGRSCTTGNVSYAATLFSGNNPVNLGSFGGELVNQANGINSAGAIVGTNSQPGNTGTRAFVAFGGTLIDLGTLGGTSSRAYAINDSGQITGSAQTGGAATHAFRYQNGVMTDLGGSTATGFAINAAGHVVGQSNFEAFIATGNAVSPIGALGSGTFSAAYGINDNDQIVGESTATVGGVSHPFLFENGVMKDLGMLASGDLGRAYAVNNSGQIVGESNLSANGVTLHAFLYQDVRKNDLNNLIPENTGWVLNSARAVNARGQIAGIGTLNGQSRAFLLALSSSSTGSGGIDSQPPRIYINGARRVVTTKSKLRVEGSSGGGVTAIQYRLNRKGAYRTAGGLLSGWRFTARLKPGKNIVQVIAVGAGGVKSNPARMTIIRADG